MKLLLQNQLKAVTDDGVLIHYLSSWGIDDMEFIKDLFQVGDQGDVDRKVKVLQRALSALMGLPKDTTQAKTTCSVLGTWLKVPALMLRKYLQYTLATEA